MSRTIIIDLPDQTDAALDEAAREEGVSPAEIAGIALKDYLAIRRFRRLRDRMTSESGRDLTDDDVFEQVS
jgi:predicted transcriptional regulator